MGYSEAEKQELQDEALRHLEDLVSIDCRQAATTIISSLPASLPSVITRLKATENILFEFLQGVMAYRLVCGLFLILLCLSHNRKQLEDDCSKFSISVLAYQMV